MKLRHIALIIAIVALLVCGLASCAPPPAGPTNPPTAGTTAPQGEMYTVTFDGVDGVPTQLVAAGQSAVKPANPSKANYNFDGWYLGDAKYDFGPVNGNVTVVAKFSPKTFAIVYDLAGVAGVENPNPESYAFSEEADLHLAPVADPADAMFFLGWSVPAIEAGTSGEITVTAKWIAKEKVLQAYNFAANEASGKTYIHYGEMQGQADDESTWFLAPNGTRQYYVSTANNGWQGFCVQDEWNPNLNFTGSTYSFWAWKSEKTLPVIEYGYDADGKIVNAWYSSTYGAGINPGFQTFTKGEDYSVSAFFEFGDAAVALGAEDVVISVDVRLQGEGAFPINFYLRRENYKGYEHGQDRIIALAIDGNGDIVVGEDTINAARVCYVDGNNNKISRKAIGNIGDGKWHTVSMEFTKTSIGYDVVIKIDGQKVGDTLVMKTNATFSTDEANLNRLMVFGGNGATVAAVDALIAADPTYTATVEFDNFVFYTK